MRAKKQVVFLNAGPVGFEPTITDLEGRCLIQTRPRARRSNGAKDIKVSIFPVKQRNTAGYGLILKCILDMSMKFEVSINLDKEKYKSYIEAVRPDIEDTVGRSSTRISEDDSSFYIYISSPDTVALRAAVGSLTRWFKVVKDIMEELD